MPEEPKLETRAHKLADLIDYHAGSVVSRTLIEKPTGTVTLFAFDKGEGLSEHTAPFDAMVWVLAGKAEVTIAGAPHQLETGEMIVMPANQPHSWKPSPDSRCCW